MLIFLLSQDADASEIKVQVCVYAFDLLYLNGKVSRVVASLQSIFLISGSYRENPLPYGKTECTSSLRTTADVSWPGVFSSS